MPGVGGCARCGPFAVPGTSLASIVFLDRVVAPALIASAGERAA